MWLVFALLAALFAALVAIFGKIGISAIDSTLATTVRSLVMSAFLVGASLILGRFSGIGSIDSRALKFIVLSGIAGALSWLFYFTALKFGLASRVAAIDRLSVVFIVILAGLFLGETLSAKSFLGAALVVIGAILISS